MTAVTRRRVQTTQIVSGWNGIGVTTADCHANQGISQHQVVVWASGLPAVGVVNVSVRPMGASFYVPVGTIDLTVNGTGTMMFCALLDGVQLTFPGGLSAGITVGATIYSVGLYFTVGDDYLQDDARRRVASNLLTAAGPWNGSGTVTMPMPDHAGLAQHQLAITGGTGLVELQGRPQGNSAWVSIDVQCNQIDTSGMLVIFAGLWDAFRLVPQGTVTGSIQAQIASVGELLFFNNVAQGTYGSSTTVPVITVNGGGQITSITSVPINVSGALGYTPIGTFNGRVGTGSPPNITLISSDVTGALGYTPENPSTFMYGFRNRIINGNFDFWQRSTTSNISAGANAYVADRFRTFSVGGSTIVVSQQSFTIGQGVVPNEPVFFCRNAVTSVAGAGNGSVMSQAMEGVRSYAGQTITVSFWAKSASAQNIALEFSQNFGSGGSPSSSVTGIGVTTIALTTSWLQYTTTISIPSISGKTIGTAGGDNLQMSWWFEAGSNFNSRTNSLGQRSGTIDISQVQVELGSQVTAFEIRPIALEFELCTRYCRIQYGSGITGYALSTTSILLSCNWSQTMRSFPTLSLLKTSFSAGTFDINVGGTWVSNASASLSSVSVNGQGTVFQMIGFSGLTANAFAIVNLAMTPLLLADADL